MIKNNKPERRKYPRAWYSLTLQVIANGYDFSTSTQNISCVGAYCHINKYVPPFTKVSVKLDLPVTELNADKKQAVECKGVIVRTEDQESGGFNIAIFFNDISTSQRNKISQYISELLSQNSSVVKRL
jgi:c-di-GMP-binding flagellar brake protein YcgR